MRKIKNAKIGQYVLATHWRDKNPNDPWSVGLVYEILITKDVTYYKIEGDARWWRHCFSISREEGAAWIETNTLLA